eukprot:6165561-Pyramimonas_sp.AAC.1
MSPEQQMHATSQGATGRGSISEGIVTSGTCVDIKSASEARRIRSAIELSVRGVRQSGHDVVSSL